MLKHIRVVPLAAESLGVRSMCTYVETPDVRILLDAGVSLCPIRFGLPPHPKEFRAINESRARIAEAAEKAEIVTLSHYHYDHHTPSFRDWLCNWTEADETARQIYEGKTVLAKNPREQVNPSQRQRGWMFQKTSGKYAERIETADAKSFIYGHTQVRFSEPVFHGPEGSDLGWVLMATVEFQGERFLFAPDVQGPMSKHACEIILAQRPNLLMIGGPPLYLQTSKVGEHQILDGLGNLEKIVETLPEVILEHHILRDENWYEKSIDVFYSAYKSGHTLKTAAEFLGKQNTFLEAIRKRLFAESPPSKDFNTWRHLIEEKRKHVKPPI
jgi:predicted metallo-beta-lactamase superfamily hydrolase